MRGFSINIRGRLKNFTLPKNQPLVPLFEAIVNSIHAIEERYRVDKEFHGRITINIIRDGQTVLKDSNELPQICSFEVIDNGIGFNDNNLTSFLESDSTYKEDFGGKGVGRFSWLLAFQKAEVKSVYWDGKKYVKREFDFMPENSEINDELIACDDQEDNQTIIKLLECKAPYLNNIPKRSETIAMRIIQYCLVYFISKKCPKIDLNDDIDGSFNLNSIFKSKIHIQSNHSKFQIKNKTFDLLHVKAEDTSINGNKLYLCAHNRLADTKELDKYIPDLNNKIYKKNKFWYVGVLQGEYLDDSVDMNRLTFNIQNDESFGNEVSMNEILEATISKIEEFLDDYLRPISDTKLKHIQDYVTNKAPQYRHLFKYMIDDITKIKPDLSNDKLDDELNQIKRKFDRQIQQENRDLLHALNKGIMSSSEYEKNFFHQIEKINSANSAALAEYVAHRRVILDLMDYAIRYNDNGNFQRESYLHDLIYPMRTTSEDIPYSNHNLWLIDEKLAYCTYISSDIPFNNDPKESRTDIMILDSPVAVSDEENTGTEYGTIVLFELKRPMRDDYSTANNPIAQLYNYVTILKNGKVKDKSGRLIKVGVNTKFYLYAICDITNTLEQVLDFYDYTQTPDKMGFYQYNKKMNAYIEILSYDKIINDAKKRNKILFDKLGI